MNTWWGAIGLCLGLLVGLIIHYWKSFVGMYGEKGGELPAIKTQHRPHPRRTKEDYRDPEQALLGNDLRPARYLDFVPVSFPVAQL